LSSPVSHRGLLRRLSAETCVPVLIAPCPCSLLLLRVTVYTHPRPCAYSSSSLSLCTLQVPCPCVHYRCPSVPWRIRLAETGRSRPTGDLQRCKWTGRNRPARIKASGGAEQACPSIGEREGGAGLPTQSPLGRPELHAAATRTVEAGEREGAHVRSASSCTARHAPPLMRIQVIRLPCPS
jgi:hypothetical protein